MRSLLETMINSAENAEQLKYRNRLWILYWTVVMSAFTGLGVMVYYFTAISPMFYAIQKILVPIFYFAAIECYFMAKKRAPDGYSHLKQAICHLGRIRTKKGSLNLRASAWFAFSFFLQSGNLLFLIPKMIKYIPSNASWIYITFASIFTAITSMLTGIVPIDLFEKAHVRLGLSSVLSSTVWILIILYGLWMHGLGSILINSIAVSLNLIAILYMVGYITHYRYVGFIQKIWMLIINFSVVLLFYLL
jgi:hypothetical protein